MVTTYEEIYTLPEISFIGGTDKLFTFTTYDDDGVTPLVITGGDVKWLLCPYGEFNITTLEKTVASGITITGASEFTVTLDAADTVTLSGKFIQQVIITDFIGNIFRPGQGTILILPAIQAS